MSEQYKTKKKPELIKIIVDRDQIIQDLLKKVGESQSEISGLKTMNQVLSRRLAYWRDEFMDAKTAHINVSVGADMGLQK